MAIIKIISGNYKSSGSIARVVRYVTRADATSPELIYSNYSSNDPEEIIRTIKQNKEKWHKTEGRQIYHEVISFPEGTITPEEAAEFGREYGYTTYGTKYHWMFAVHIDKNCIHIHFVVDSVSVETGKKYPSTGKQLEEKRHLVSDMCAFRHMPIAEKGYNAKGEPLPEGYVTSYNRGTYEARADQQKQQRSWKYQMYKAIDNAKAKSVNQEEFRERLNEQGYNWEMRGKTLVFIEVNNPHHRMRATTLNSTFHVNYTTDGLDQAFVKNELDRRLTHGQILYVRVTPEILQTKQVSLMTLRNNDALFSLLDCMPAGAAKRDLYLIIETVEALHALFKFIIDLIDKQYEERLHTYSLNEHRLNRGTYKGSKIDAYDTYMDSNRMSNLLNPGGPVFNKSVIDKERIIERKRIVKKPDDNEDRDSRMR